MYDTIVIGNDLSSLIAALLSSRYGRKTLLLSEGNIPDSYSESDYTFNVDPFPWTGFGSEQIFLQLLSELDIPIPDESDIFQLDPALQVILPKHRIDLYNERNSLVRDMEREFSGNEKRIRKLYAVAEKSSKLTRFIRGNPFVHQGKVEKFSRFVGNILIFIGSKLILAGIFKGTQDPPSLRRVFEAQLLLLSNLYTSRVESLSSAYILSLPWEGLFYHRGGKGILIDTLRKKFMSTGGDYINNISIMRLNVKEDEGEGEIGVDIDTKDNMFTVKGKKLIVSTKWERFKQIFFHDKRFSKLARRFESLKAVYHPFTVHMGVFDKGLPEKIAEHVIIIGDEGRSVTDNRRPVTDNNCIFLEVSSPGDTGCAPHGKRAISATMFLNESPLRLNDNVLKGISTKILEILEGPLPFLKENLDFINIEKSIEISRKYQEVVNQKYKTSGSLLPDISILSNKTPLKNVFITGGMLLAGLGFEGEVVSGVNAARQAEIGAAK